jgi:hypothetical protein
VNEGGQMSDKLQFAVLVSKRQSKDYRTPVNADSGFLVLWLERRPVFDQAGDPIGMAAFSRPHKTAWLGQEFTPQ